MAVQLLGRSEKGPQLNLPLFVEGQSSDLPSVDMIDDLAGIDLNTLCIRRPANTFLVAAESDAMVDGGIHPGDILVVDRSLKAEHGHIIIAGFQGELTVRELQLRPSPRLIAYNNSYESVVIPEDSELEIYGVVTQIIHTLAT